MKGASKGPTCGERIIINGTGHIAGRLAGCVAKSLLEGKHVVILCAESICFNSPQSRAELKYRSYLHKRCLTKPSRGPFHYREPSKFFWRIVRGMIKYKRKRGSLAMSRLEVYNGIPERFSGLRRSICPRALAKYKSNPIRKKCTLGDLLSKFGWKHQRATEEFKMRILKAEMVKKEEEKENLKRISEIMNSENFKREVDRIMESFD